MRSPISVSQGALGASPWIPLDWEQRPFDVALAASLDYLGNLTYTVQYSPDNPNKPLFVGISRTTTVATVTFVNPHGLVVNDSLPVFGSGDPNLDGVQIVASVPSATTLTYAVSNTGLTSGLPSSQGIPMRVFTFTPMSAQTTKADGNMSAPCAAVRIKVTAYTAGVVTLSVSQGHARG